MTKFEIKELYYNGRKVCEQIISAPGCSIDIESVREDLLSKQTTELKKQRIREMNPSEVLFELLYRDEIRSEVNENHNRIKNGAKKSNGEVVPLEDAMDIPEITEKYDFNKRAYDSQREISDFEDMSEIEEEITKNTTPYQKKILYSRIKDGIPREQLAKDLGTNSDNISKQQSKILKKLKKNENLRSVFARLKHCSIEETEK